MGILVIILLTFGKEKKDTMKGISYLTDEVGQKKAVVIDLEILKNRDGLLEILEDIEDEIAIELRKDEPSYNWEEVRIGLINED